MISRDLVPQKNFDWYDVQDPTNEDFQELAQKFTLPQLLAQDILKPEHLPKYEFTEEGHFFILRSFDPQAPKNGTTVQELTRRIVFFMNEKRLVTIHRRQSAYLDNVIKRTQKGENAHGVHALTHQIILELLRTYEEPLNRLGDLIGEFEEDIFSKSSERINTDRVYLFRRQIFILKRVLALTNEALYRSKDFWNHHISMWQDLKENLDHISFQLDDISHNFDHLFQLHVALNDQRANDIMKVLTVFSTVLLPLNFIASFYGMNFTALPGLHSGQALLFLILLMLALCVFAVWYFKKKGWFKTARE